MIVKEVNNSSVYYDEEFDILHVHYPPQEASYDDEDYPGIIIRRAMKDERITGIVIINYKRKKKENKDLSKFLPFVDKKDLISV